MSVRRSSKKGFAVQPCLNKYLSKCYYLVAWLREPAKNLCRHCLSCAVKNCITNSFCFAQLKSATLHFSDFP